MQLVNHLTGLRAERAMEIVRQQNGVILIVTPHIEKGEVIWYQANGLFKIIETQRAAQVYMGLPFNGTVDFNYYMGMLSGHLLALNMSGNRMGYTPNELTAITV